uniref:Repressor-like protein n=1 Tax=Vibrio cholerae TaxID=666 RepID=A0A023UJS8_VIBCL|nr:repressor-like protein [Vibrio cholerae]
MKKKYTSVRVSESTKMKLERVAIDVSYATKESIKRSDVANYLFDQYSNEAKADLIHKKTDLKR